MSIASWSASVIARRAAIRPASSGSLSRTEATEEGTFGIVNINALEPAPESLPVPQPMSYEGETTDQRACRRQQRWSPADAALR
jgi:hypothetical protein